MFKIDKNKAFCFISMVMVAGTLGISACGNNASSDSYDVNINSNAYEKRYISVEEATRFVLLCENGTAIIVPTDLHKISYDTLCRVCTYYVGDYPHFEHFGMDCYVNSFYNYEEAKNVALVISDEVYLYEDVINGNPVNLHDVRPDDFENTTLSYNSRS